MIRERRRFIRFKVPLDMEVSGQGTGSFLLTGRSIDFSRQGVRLSLPFNFFSSRQSLQFKISLPESRHTFCFKGRACWSLKQQNCCQVGVKIEEMAPEDKNDLLEYAYNLWRKEEYGS